VSALALLTDLDERLDAAMLRVGATPQQLTEIRYRVDRRDAFDRAQARISRWWPSFIPLFKAQTGAIATLQFAGVQHSIALFTMGESGSGKSMEMKAYTGTFHHERVLRVDKFTIPALLSGYGESKKEDLEQAALFRRVKQRVMVTPDLARIFRGRTTGVLEERFGELAGWLDGEGIVQWTGTHGVQGAEGDFTCVWFGCTTPFHIQVWRTMERLGQRLLFYPAAKIGPAEEVPEEQLSEAIADLQTAARDVLDVLFSQHKPRTVKPWPKRPPEIDEEINRLTDLLAAGHVIAGGNTAAEPSTRPDVKHFRSRIREIVSGAVWVTGRQTADQSDINDIVRPIVQRSMPQSRGPVLLAIYDGICEVKDIAKRTGLAGGTVQATLHELKRAGVVEEAIGRQRAIGAPSSRWLLVPQE
jgi:hypothetical protein